MVSLGRLSFAAPESDARGPLDEALRDGLFEVAYGAGYYAGYTDNEALLAVANPDWEVHVWQRDPETGELVEVAKVTGEDNDDDDDDDELEEGELVITEIEIDEDCDWCWDQTWLSLTVAAEFNVLNPSGVIELPSSRFRANSLPGFDDEGFPAALRGVDVRMGAFPARRPSDYPHVEGYFRSGYTEGHASFRGSLDDGGFAEGEATSFDYLTVPLFFGGNIYFPDWPVRPYAGAGFGFDVLWTQYRRHQAESVTDLSLRIGFELHGGIDIRITNYFGLFGEVRQLWSARRKMSGLPDFSNTGFTVVSGLKFGIPVGRGARATDRREARERGHRIRVVETREGGGEDEPEVTNIVIPGAPGTPSIITTTPGEPPVSTPAAAPPAPAPVAPPAAAPEAPPAPSAEPAAEPSAESAAEPSVVLADE